MHDPAALLEIATFVGVLRNSTVEPTMFQRSLSTQIDEIIEYLKSIKLGQSAETAARKANEAAKLSTLT